MVTVERSTIVNAPIERVWGVLRDFNGHDSWHPLVSESRIEEGRSGDRVGAVRRFLLKDGSLLREQLLYLSDRDHAFGYCLYDTPIPLLNYVAHVVLKRVTDRDRTFWKWWSSFVTPPGRARELQRMVADEVYGAGIAAVRKMVERR
jgi:Polyketide cyclase / dehydrase and lipid transport